MSRKDRLSTVASVELGTESLVGSYFHSDHTRGWQGCIVAEPHPGYYLVELFSWLAGESTEQQLVQISDMTGWSFYDDAQWMNNSAGPKQREWDNQKGQTS